MSCVAPSALPVTFKEWLRSSRDPIEEEETNHLLSSHTSLNLSQLFQTISTTPTSFDRFYSSSFDSRMLLPNQSSLGRTTPLLILTACRQRIEALQRDRSKKMSGKEAVEQEKKDETIMIDIEPSTTTITGDSQPKRRRLAAANTDATRKSPKKITKAVAVALAAPVAVAASMVAASTGVVDPTPAPVIVGKKAPKVRQKRMTAKELALAELQREEAERVERERAINAATVGVPMVVSSDSDRSAGGVPTAIAVPPIPAAATAAPVPMDVDNAPSTEIPIQPNTKAPLKRRNTRKKVNESQHIEAAAATGLPTISTTSSAPTTATPPIRIDTSVDDESMSELTPHDVPVAVAPIGLSLALTTAELFGSDSDDDNADEEPHQDIVDAPLDPHSSIVADTPASAAVTRSTAKNSAQHLLQSKQRAADKAKLLLKHKKPKSAVATKRKRAAGPGDDATTSVTDTSGATSSSVLVVGDASAPPPVKKVRQSRKKKDQSIVAIPVPTLATPINVGSTSDTSHRPTVATIVDRTQSIGSVTTTQSIGSSVGVATPTTIVVSSPSVGPVTSPSPVATNAAHRPIAAAATTIPSPSTPAPIATAKSTTHTLSPTLAKMPTTPIVTSNQSNVNGKVVTVSPIRNRDVSNVSMTSSVPIPSRTSSTATAVVTPSPPPPILLSPAPSFVLPPAPPSVSVPRRRRTQLAAPTVVMVTNEGEMLLPPPEPTPPSADANKNNNTPTTHTNKKLTKKQKWRANQRKKKKNDATDAHNKQATTSTPASAATGGAGSAAAAGARLTPIPTVSPATTPSRPLFV